MTQEEFDNACTEQVNMLPEAFRAFVLHFMVLMTKPRHNTSDTHRDMIDNLKVIVSDLQEPIHVYGSQLAAVCCDEEF